MVPLILIVAFEQSYVIHKRKTAKFCTSGLTAATASSHAVPSAVSPVCLRPPWLVAPRSGLQRDYECAGDCVDNAYLLKQQRFTTKCMAKIRSLAIL